MARGIASDFFHNMRFVVQIADGQNDFLAISRGEAGAQAGFSAVTTPEYTVEAVEYREGNYIFTRKYPGLPTTADITMSRGVVLKDTAFYDWIMEVIEGNGDYRVDLLITHYNRAALPGAPPVGTAPTEVVGVDTITSAPRRVYNVLNAFCMRDKIASDLDATASDVSITEMDVSYETFFMSEFTT